jgi:hypothetical protein
MGESPLFGSPLGGGGEPENPLARLAEPSPSQPPRPGPSFGGLKANAAARGRREKVKFFDSADWASGRQGSDSERATPDRLSELTQASAGDAPVAADAEASPLTGD